MLIMEIIGGNTYSMNSRYINTDCNDTIIYKGVYINKIFIQGNKVTDDDIILRELSITENKFAFIKDIDEDIQRVYNLGLFNKVDFIPVPIGDNKINLIISVEETFYDTHSSSIRDIIFKNPLVNPKVYIKEYKLTFYNMLQCLIKELEAKKTK